MKKSKFLIAAVLFASLFACSGGSEKSENNENSDTAKTEDLVENDGAIDPFKDFPKDKIMANAGDYVLTPSVNWQRDATEQGYEKVTFIFYKATLAGIGDEYSKVDFLGEKGVEIPNYMIIPIKAEQTAKVGDIILTWWQSGSGMERAIVTDASDPKAPFVNYIDIDWDNPAKNKEGVGIGQQTEQIEESTFHVISSKWQPGTSVAVKEGKDYKLNTIVKVSGNKVLTIGFAGKMNMYNKDECTPLEVKPNVKVGDEVQAPWSSGKFINTKVIKVDQKFGRVWCEDPYSDDPMVIPFGDITTGLDIK
jgi:hypothetical protein